MLYLLYHVVRELSSTADTFFRFSSRMPPVSHFDCAFFVNTGSARMHLLRTQPAFTAPDTTPFRTGITRKSVPVSLSLHLIAVFSQPAPIGPSPPGRLISGTISFYSVCFQQPLSAFAAENRLKCCAASLQTRKKVVFYTI